MAKKRAAPRSGATRPSTRAHETAVNRPRLPVELIDRILQHYVAGFWDRAAVRAVFPFSLCCRQFSDLALRTSWASVTIRLTGYRGEDCHPMEKLRYILATPRLHNYITTLRIVSRGLPDLEIGPELKLAATLIDKLPRLAHVEIGETRLKIPRPLWNNLILPRALVVAIAGKETIRTLDLRYVAMVAPWPSRLVPRLGAYRLTFEGADFGTLWRFIDLVPPDVLVLRMRIFGDTSERLPPIETVPHLDLDVGFQDDEDMLSNDAFGPHNRKARAYSLDASRGAPF